MLLTCGEWYCYPLKNDMLLACRETDILALRRKEYCWRDGNGIVLWRRRHCWTVGDWNFFTVKKQVLLWRCQCCWPLRIWVKLVCGETYNATVKEVWLWRWQFCCPLKKEVLLACEVTDIVALWKSGFCCRDGSVIGLSRMGVIGLLKGWYCCTFKEKGSLVEVIVLSAIEERVLLACEETDKLKRAKARCKLQ